jgi:hypothetical protein
VIDDDPSEARPNATDAEDAVPAADPASVSPGSGRRPHRVRRGMRSRVRNLVLCGIGVVLAAVLGVAAHRLEVAQLAPDHGVVGPTAFGWGTAVFVMVLVAAMFAIAQIVDYKRRRSWITVALLAGFLLLKARAWQQANALAAAILAPAVPDAGGLVADPPAQGMIDALWIASYILGGLCVVSTLATMRRIGLLRSSGKRRPAASEDLSRASGADADDIDDLQDIDEAAVEVRRRDDDLALSTTAPAAEADPAALDAVLPMVPRPEPVRDERPEPPASVEAEAPVVDAEAPATPRTRRVTRLFE